MTVQPGDIALYSGDDLYSKAISLVTGNKWTHCGIVVEVDASGPVVIEATQQGLLRTPIGGVPGWQCRDAGDVVRSQVVAWAMRKYKENCGYNYFDIFCIALHLLCKRFSLVVEGTGRYFCSEFNAWALVHGGANIGAPELLSPGDLDKLYPTVVQ